MKINASKIKLAQHFLNQLKKELPRIKTKENLILEMYSNGREQGYHLRCMKNGRGEWWGCSFSEARCSDQLVVYIGLGILTFQSTSGNTPDDGTYHKGLYYNCDDKSLRLAVTNVLASLELFLLDLKQEARA